MRSAVHSVVLFSLILAALSPLITCHPIKITRTITNADRERLIHPDATPSDPVVTPRTTAGSAVPFPANGIVLHSGNPMTTGMNVYIIWYGSWVDSAKSIIRNFINSLGPQNPYTAGSVRAWWAINSLYYDNSGVLIDPTIVLVKEVNDNYSLGKSLTDASILTIVKTQISAGSLPKDSKGLYLVLTSKDVNVRFH